MCKNGFFDLMVDGVGDFFKKTVQHGRNNKSHIRLDTAFIC
jgi:hypothetical protein